MFMIKAFLLPSLLGGSTVKHQNVIRVEIIKLGHKRREAFRLQCKWHLNTHSDILRNDQLKIYLTSLTATT